MQTRCNDATTNMSDELINRELVIRWMGKSENRHHISASAAQGDATIPLFMGYAHGNLCT